MRRPITITTHDELQALAAHVANARTALDDPAGLDPAEFEPYAEEERRLPTDDPNPAPEGSFLYTLAELDAAINALRRLYEPEEGQADLPDPLATVRVMLDHVDAALASRRCDDTGTEEYGRLTGQQATLRAVLDFLEAAYAEPVRALVRMLADAETDVDDDEERWAELATGQDTEEAEESGRLIGRAQGLREALQLLTGAPVATSTAATIARDRIAALRADLHDLARELREEAAKDEGLGPWLNATARIVDRIRDRWPLPAVEEVRS